MAALPTQLFDTFRGAIKCIDFYLSIAHEIHTHTICAGSSAIRVFLITIAHLILSLFIEGVRSLVVCTVIFVLQQWQFDR